MPDVPCNGCSQCCQGPQRILTLDPETEDLSAYETYTDEHGRTLLAGRVDGTCIYLQGGKCSIYERRPLACRNFDCAYLPGPYRLEDIPMRLRHAAAMRLTR